MASETHLRTAQMRTVTTVPETPLLYVLTDELALQGPRFGFGIRLMWLLLGISGWRRNQVVHDPAFEDREQVHHYTGTREGLSISIKQ